ncbi:MAG: GFA family protein [Kiloniellales bacterium]
MTDQWTGGCLCGKVRFRVKAPQAQVIACHCRQCRRVSGHYFAASAAAWPDLELTASEGLAWYQSAATSRRGFCRLCGSSLFFDHGPDEPLGIAAGAFDEEPPFKLAVHIWVDEAGKYYELSDDLPAYSEAEWRKGGWRAYRHGERERLK